MLTEIDQTQKNTIWFFLGVEPKKIQFIKPSIRTVVVRGRVGGNGELLVKGYRISVINEWVLIV